MKNCAINILYRVGGGEIPIVALNIVDESVIRLREGLRGKRVVTRLDILETRKDYNNWSSQMMVNLHWYIENKFRCLENDNSEFNTVVISEEDVLKAIRQEGVMA